MSGHSKFANIKHKKARKLTKQMDKKYTFCYYSQKQADKANLKMTTEF